MKQEIGKKAQEKQAKASARREVKRLRDSENRYRRLFETAQDGILILDADTGNIEDVNPYLTKMLGCSREDLVGEKLWEINPFKYVAASKSAFEELQRQEFVRFEDLHIETIDGGRMDVEFVSNNYEVDHQRVIQCNIRDITERRRAEEALGQIRGELEIRVQERTQELNKTNEKLRIEIEERQRLAQNLHDAVNQSLFSAGLIAEVLPRLWERDQEAARQSLADLRRLTRGALAEMRALLAELRPSVLTDSSLGDLLRQLANAFTGRTNIPVSLNIAGEHVLPAGIQVAFYRICQEAFNNIAKHAGASQVEINLKYVTGTRQASSSVAQAAVPQEIAVSSVEMRIRDNGHGFDTSELSAPGHYGLDMMLERAEAVGAQLTITSQPDHGTELTLVWPGRPKQEAP